MFILHVVRHSLVQRTPARTAAYWGRYTEHSGQAVCSGRAGGRGQYQEPLNPYGMFYSQGKRGRLRALLDRADVVHCHDDAYPDQYVSKRKGQVCVYHAHIGDIPERFFGRGRMKYQEWVRHACITNGYGRKFDVERTRKGIIWGRLPDILDLHHPLYSPVSYNKPGPLRVVFTYSNNHEPGRKINAKGPGSTRKILKNLNRKIDLRFITRVPFERSMAEKQAAHIVLDEIFSPYTHLASLEGAAVGACVLTSYDEYTVKELCHYVGAPFDSYPFVLVTPANVVEKLEYFRHHVGEAIEIGRASREWMLKYYDPAFLLQKYLDFYRGK